jgi:hypothetical protein
MIRNPSRLYQGCPVIPGLRYNLRLIEWYIMAPLAAEWDIELTSAYRSTTGQAGLYVLDEKRAARKAKGTSQHVLGEAVDFIVHGADIRDCFKWCLQLRPWQAILEYHSGRPECIHLSIPSAIETIVSKRLLFLDPPGDEPGRYENFTGSFPEAA